MPLLIPSRKKQWVKFINMQKERNDVFGFEWVK